VSDDNVAATGTRERPLRRGIYQVQASTLINLLGLPPDTRILGTDNGIVRFLLTHPEMPITPWNLPDPFIAASYKGWPNKKFTEWQIVPWDVAQQ
jgi:hypothetical protein